MEVCIKKNWILNSLQFEIKQNKLFKTEPF